MTEKPIHIKDFGPVQWVWLDLDDTLWDFKHNSHISLGEIYQSHALNRWWPDVDSWRDHYHRVNDQLWKLYAPGLITRDTLRRDRFLTPLTQAGCPGPTARQLTAELDIEYLRLLGQKSVLIHGARQLLTRLHHSGYKIGILSNGFYPTQQQKMESAGIINLIDTIVLSDDIDINKPDIRIYKHAAKKTGIPDPHAHLMIGDNPDTDICGAINAGWTAIWFNPQNKPITPALEQAMHTHAHTVVTNTTTLDFIEP